MMAAEPFEGNEEERGFGERLTRKEQIIEVAVFLLLIVPTMILAYFVTQRGDATGFTVLAVATILRDLSLVALILFFVWRNGEGTERIGWTYKHEWADMALGIVLFFPLLFLISALNVLFQRLGLSGPQPGAMQELLPHGTGQFVLAVVLVIVVAISEEVIFRGYLIRRFSSMFQSVGLAVLFSAVVFAFGHGYQGGAGVFTIGVVGLVFGLIYVWRGSLMAPVVMHLLQNFVSIVVVPYMLPR